MNNASIFVLSHILLFGVVFWLISYVVRFLI